jgi:hypothetical protein
MSSPVSGAMAALKASALLGEESEMLVKIRELKHNLRYNTDDQKFALDDVLAKIADEINNIPKLDLDNNIQPGTETTYQIQLTQVAEQIVNECDRLYQKINQFSGKLREAERQVQNLHAAFNGWYVMAITMLFKDMDDVKLPLAEARKIADAEFSELLGGLDVALITLIEQTKQEKDRIAHYKAAQKEKYDYGIDQANATYASTLPAFGNAFTEDRGNVSGVQELDDEDEPVQISKPLIASDTLRILKPEIQGTFKKTGDPQPVTLLVEEEEVQERADKCHCDSNEVYAGHRDSCSQSAVYRAQPERVTARRKLIEEEDE